MLIQGGAYLQAGLEGAGHDLVMGPGAVEQQQVDVEEEQVQEHWEHQQSCGSGQQVTDHPHLWQDRPLPPAFRQHLPKAPYPANHPRHPRETGCGPQ